MNKRWLIALLIVSFSFNLAVVFSFLYFRVLDPPTQHYRGQMPHFSPRDRLRSRSPETVALNKRFNATKITLMEELAKDPISETNIATIIDSSVVAQIDLERHLGKRLLENRRNMTAAEAREHFLKRAEFLRNRTANQHHRRPRR